VPEGGVPRGLLPGGGRGGGTASPEEGCKVRHIHAVPYVGRGQGEAGGGECSRGGGEREGERE